MKLSDLLGFSDIIIQCHNHPDADTISSGFGLYLYYQSHGKNVRMIYSGKEQIRKTSLKMMIAELGIPIEYISNLEERADIIITVDCQYGEGNVAAFETNNIAVIDHHQDCGHDKQWSEIRDSYGSCATLVYKMLLEESYPIKEDEKLMTALFYGLYMDTNAFGEIKHPYDYDMMEELNPDVQLFQQLKNNNFTFHELEIAASALMRYEYYEAKRFAIVRANPCDPNLLGFISDLLLQVEGVDTCLAYCEFEYGVKFSVRNCASDITASEIVQYLIKNMGTGGGHKNKAGGYIIRKNYEENHPEINLLAYFLNSMNDYFTSHEILHAKSEQVEISIMQLYERIPLTFGVYS